MRRHIIDASAILAFVFEEPGADKASSFFYGGIISAVNYSEVIARSIHGGMPLEKATRTLDLIPLQCAQFGLEEANVTATLKAPTKHLGLSIADRACLALGILRSLPVVTGDRRWLEAGLDVEIILFR